LFEVTNIVISVPLVGHLEILIYYLCSYQWVTRY